jgi:hypothetical protein
MQYISPEIFYSLSRYGSYQTKILKNLRRTKSFIQYIEFIKDLGLCRSAVMGRLQVKGGGPDDQGIRVYPFIGPHISDKDMLQILTRYILGEGLKMDSFDVMQMLRDEIVKNNNAPIMLLDRTTRELIENGRIAPPACAKFGFPERFLKKYEKYVTDEAWYKFKLFKNMEETLKTGHFGNKFDSPEWLDFRSII